MEKDGMNRDLMMKNVRAEAEEQQQLISRIKELEALSSIQTAASGSLDLIEILKTAQERMVELIGIEAVEMRIVESGRLVLKVHHGVSPEFLISEQIVQFGHCSCGKCALTGQVIAIDSLTDHQFFSQSACAREGFQSSLSVPMKTKGRVVGVIHIANRKKGVFSLRDQEILTSIADQLAMAIENAQLYDQARRRALHLETVSLAGQQMASQLSLDTLLPDVVKLLRDKFGFYHSSILMVDEATHELVLREASGPRAEALREGGLRLKIGNEGIAGWVAYSGQALLCNDIKQEPRFYTTEIVPRTKSELAVPMRAGNKIIGVLDIQSDITGAFDREDVILLQIIASQLATAVENARLFQETKSRYSAMVTLHELSLDIVSQLDMEELLGSLLRRGTQLLHAHAGQIFLSDPSEGLIKCVAGYNTFHDWSHVTLQSGEGIAGQVILRNNPVIVNDYEKWEAKYGVLLGSRIRHNKGMGAPLKWQGQVIGAIVFLNEVSALPFDQSDLWLMDLFADLATIAIKNAELHTQVKNFGQDLENKVIERTKELIVAKEEIGFKAKQLSSLLTQTLRIQEEERTRIARDLHDSIIQFATAAKYEVQAAQLAAGDTLSPSTSDKMNAAIEALEEMRKEIRETIYDLHPAILDSEGLVSAAQKFAKRFQEVSGVACDVQVMGIPTELTPPSVIAIYRLVEEALQNVATHAKAKSATVIIDYEPTTLCVTVQDDGQGFDYQHWDGNQSAKHFGLLGMRERVEGLTGEMKVWSEPEKGTRLTFRVPIKMEGVE